MFRDKRKMLNENVEHELLNSYPFQLDKIKAHARYGKRQTYFNSDIAHLDTWFE